MGEIKFGTDGWRGVIADDFTFANVRTAAEAICRETGATLVIAAGTSRWCRTLPGVAHRLGGRADTHVTGLPITDGAVSISRWYYRQRMEATIRRTQRPWVILVDPGCLDPWEGADAAASVHLIDVQLPAGCLRTAVSGFLTPAADAQTIRPDADLLFVAGAGWTKVRSPPSTSAFWKRAGRAPPSC